MALQIPFAIVNTAAAAAASADGCYSCPAGPTNGNGTPAKPAAAKPIQKRHGPWKWPQPNCTNNSPPPDTQQTVPLPSPPSTMQPDWLGQMSGQRAAVLLALSPSGKHNNNGKLGVGLGGLLLANLKIETVHPIIHPAAANLIA